MFIIIFRGKLHAHTNTRKVEDVLLLHKFVNRTCVKPCNSVSIIVICVNKLGIIVE
jgi:hypothetical protein